MKKAVVAILVLLLMAGIFFLNRNTEPDSIRTFYAAITEIQDSSLTVKGTGENDIHHRDIFQFTIGKDTQVLHRYTDISLEDLKEGDRICVAYTGEVLEINPKVLTQVLYIQRLDDKTQIEKESHMIFEKKVAQMFRSRLCTRQDNPNGIFYFAPEDFPGLQAHPYTFQSGMGHDLKGYFYHYENPVPGRVVVFDHGMGNGHRAYMREIETLCKGGWLVFSYDHTGCMESGGKDINGFSQSLADLDDCMTALEAEPALQGYSFAVIGHSWGGFSTMNIAALHPEITHVIPMSGFISVEQIFKQSLPGIMGVYAASMVREEQKGNPKYARINGLETLEKTKAKVLVIHSDDDKTVHKDKHYDPLLEKLSGRENIEFLLLTGKDHNPTYTVDAVTYKNAFWGELSKAIKEKQLETPEQQKPFMDKYDWWRMTQQDMDVWNRIFDHLKK